MPSQAYQDFKHNRVDVMRLIANHGSLHSGAPGKKGLGHITRSGVVMLCASWELYAETLLIEALTCLLRSCASPDQLPLNVQRSLSKYVREAKHELKPLSLAGDGWKAMLLEYANAECGALNTPKSGPLNALFKTFLDLTELSSCWSGDGKDRINRFVGVRGDIAHRGRDASYVALNKLKDYLSDIEAMVVETDNCVRTHIKSIAPSSRAPWNLIP